MEEGEVVQMNTLEELIYYCREPDPVGALLLSGEWGCGKTYLIEHGLKKAFENEVFVLRISLFGISSLEGVHAAVKQLWMDAYYQEKGIGGAAEKAQKAKEIVSKFDFLPDWVKGVASTNWTSFIEIKDKIEEKPVILIFDDLERCRMDSIDVLGAINDYCENMKFHTIIIANQDKMQTNQKATKINAEIEYNDSINSKLDNKINKKATLAINIPPKIEPGSISYSEIKEKIIQRTIKYIPDYVAIVHTVIESLKCEETESGEEGYKTFVHKCEAGLLELFAPDRDHTETKRNTYWQVDDIVNENQYKPKERPHNIRSLKCAINDFYRIYKILVENNFENIDRWFYSFASYVIAYKADIAKEGYYGTIFSDKEVKLLYPAFQTQYIFKGAKEWILHGVWDKELIVSEIAIIKKREKADTPEEIVRTHRFIDIDEDTVNKGFLDVLEMAYSGELVLDEYVQFIINNCWSRMYGFQLPVSVDWLKVQEGVRICIKKLVESLPEGQQLHSIIGSENKENFSEEEWNTYEIIDDFKNGNVLMFSKNRKLYIEGMKKDIFSTFLETQNKRFNVFDDEMAVITAEAYKNGNNSDKSQFPDYFNKMWQGNIMSQDFNVNESLEGFQKLLDLLINLKDELEKENKAFALRHTVVYVQTMIDLIVKAKKIVES